VRASVTADGKISANSDPFTLDVRRAELKTTVAGPKLAYLDQDFTWTITVANAGDGPFANLTVRATLPPEVKLKEAGDGRPGAGWVEWRLASLKAGEQKVLSLTVDAAKLNDKATLSVLATADATGGMDGATVGDPVQSRAESTVPIIGTPALSLQVVPPAGPIDVGKTATFQIRVSNKGTVSARNIDIAAFAPAELKAARASGKAEGQIDQSGTIRFPTLEELRPGETAAYVVELNAVQAGDARFRTEVKAADLTAPLTDEHAARIVGK
jgi:uncharacterized repeat protein (TIGR01451 family)